MTGDNYAIVFRVQNRKLASFGRCSTIDRWTGLPMGFSRIDHAESFARFLGLGRYRVVAWQKALNVQSAKLKPYRITL